MTAEIETFYSGVRVFADPCSHQVEPKSTQAWCSTVALTGATVVSSCGESMCYAELAGSGSRSYIALHECTGVWSKPENFRLKRVPVGKTNVGDCAASKQQWCSPWCFGNVASLTKAG